jgi:hypothetical protein
MGNFELRNRNIDILYFNRLVGFAQRVPVRVGETFLDEVEVVTPC